MNKMNKIAEEREAVQRKLSDLFALQTYLIVNKRQTLTLIQRCQSLSLSLSHSTSHSLSLESFQSFYQILLRIETFLSQFIPSPSLSLPISPSFSPLQFHYLIMWYEDLVYNQLKNLKTFQDLNNELTVVRAIQSNNQSQSYYNENQNCEDVREDLMDLENKLSSLRRQLIGPDQLSNKNKIKMVRRTLMILIEDWNHEQEDLQSFQMELNQVIRTLKPSEEITKQPKSNDNSPSHIQSQLTYLSRMVEDFNQNNCHFPQQVMLIDSLNSSLLSAIEESNKASQEYLRKEMDDFKLATFQFHEMTASQYNQINQQLQNLLLAIDRLKVIITVSSEAKEQPKTEVIQSIPVHTSRSRLENGQTLEHGAELMSDNQGYKFCVQRDGNLVVYARNGSGWKALWASNTDRKGYAPYRLVMQSDSHLVQYDSSARGKATWATGVFNKGAKGAYAVMQNDGNFVVYDGHGTALWCTRTEGGRKSPYSGKGDRLA